MKDIKSAIIKPKQNNLKNTILIVEDETMLCEHISFYLSDEYTIHAAPTGNDALTIAKSNHIDLILLDIYLPDIKGTDLIPLFKKINPKIKIIVITAYKEMHYAAEAIQHGANNYLTKPFQKMDLQIAISKAFNPTETTKKSSTYHFKQIEPTFEEKIERINQLITKRKTTQKKITMADIYDHFPELRKSHIIGKTEIPIPIIENKVKTFIQSLNKNKPLSSQ